MIDLVKKFIEDNIKLIELNEWEEIYEKASAELKLDTGKFTEVILEADIHPEDYLKELPKNFLYESNVKKFRIPDNIKSIDSSAFEYCISLTSMTIGNSVTTIGDEAFSWCTGLTSVIIPDSVTSIGKYAFYRCTRFTSMIIPNSVAKISSYAFRGCTSLTNVLIENPEITFADNVFGGCNHLDIQFAGTKKQWKNIAKSKFLSVTYTCKCVDGVVKKSR